MDFQVLEVLITFGCRDRMPLGSSSWGNIRNGVVLTLCPLCGFLTKVYLTPMSTEWWARLIFGLIPHGTVLFGCHLTIKGQGAGTKTS